MDSSRIVFVGGGNMAGAIVGGLVKAGRAADSITVVEPADAARERLRTEFGVHTLPAADATLAHAGLVVWAVKPQVFGEAAAPCAAYVGQALHLSVMAGIRSAAIAAATGSERIVRAMPNTPALIGRGICGLFAREAVDAADRALVEQVLAPTGGHCWVPAEADLDAVTALSGSGPAYVFYLLEGMVAAGESMGLAPATARELAQTTLAGSAALALQSADPPAVLRERVTSKGGTTAAAVEVLEAAGVKATVVEAIAAARRRATALGEEYGSTSTAAPR